MSFSEAHERLPRAVSYLITLLVRYPEVSTVRYNPREKSIRFTFMVEDAKSATRAAERLLEALELYNHLSGREPVLMTTEVEDLGSLVLLGVTRDVHSLTQEEIFTAVEFLQQELEGRLISDASATPEHEEEWMLQEEMIEEMLRDLGRGRGGKALHVFRDEGRVVLFQK